MASGIELTKFSAFIQRANDLWLKVDTFNASESIKDVFRKQIQNLVSSMSLAVSAQKMLDASILSNRLLINLSVKQAETMLTSALMGPIGAILLFGGQWMRAENREDESKTRKYLCITAQLIGVGCVALSSFMLVRSYDMTKRVLSVVQTSLRLAIAEKELVNRIESQFIGK